MALLRALHYRSLQTLLKPSHLEISPFTAFISLSPHVYSTISSTSISCGEESKTTKKPLHILFTEAVGLSEKPYQSDRDDDESNELKKRLWKLEQQVKKLKENKKTEEVKVDHSKKIKSKPKSTSLFKLFADEADKNWTIRDLEEDRTVYRELWPDMISFVTHLYEQGYFRDANFVGAKFDVSCFENSYARMFIKGAAEKFGEDNQEIAKWVSAGDLKKVALFGCPTLGKKNVFAAKKLRVFFEIHEAMVCGNCALKTSCKFMNQGVWKFDTRTLHLASVMRVLTLYALESTHPQLLVPNEIKNAVSRLLKEILNLSQTLA